MSSDFRFKTTSSLKIQTDLMCSAISSSERGFPFDLLDSPLDASISDSRPSPSLSRSSKSLLLNRLTEDAILTNILEFVGEPEITGKVCKKFRELSEDISKTKVLTWQQEPIFNTIIQRIRSQRRANISYLELHNRSCRSIQRIEDENLIQFFDRLIPTMPFYERFKLKYLHTKAHAIRKWMHKNQAILNKIKSLDLSRAGLKILPLEMNQLVYLERLNLTNNRLLRIELGRLEHLDTLHLNENQVAILSSTFNGVVHLHPLEVIPPQPPAALDTFIQPRDTFAVARATAMIEASM